jgi:hypothetical protein
VRRKGKMNGLIKRIPYHRGVLRLSLLIGLVSGGAGLVSAWRELVAAAGAFRVREIVQVTDVVFIASATAMGFIIGFVAAFVMGAVAAWVVAGFTRRAAVE